MTGISTVLSKVRANTVSLSEPSHEVKPLGDPNCPQCGGVGYVRFDVPVGHEKFGKLESCVCRAKDVAASARSRLFAMSNLEHLGNLSFENFNALGSEKAKFITPQERESLHQAFEVCEEFARSHAGWLLLEGGYGCGKTHLAAAIANHAVSKGVLTLFITVPDLLDSLRFAFNDPETTFEQRFSEIRTADLLVLDDFGTQNATSWSQEKIFQIMNYRYINKLPTVITTNLMLDAFEGRVRSRLQDEELVRHLKISAPDYRRPEETSNPGISMLTLPEMKKMTFGNFQTREEEAGRESLTTSITERQDKFGGIHKDKTVTRVKVSTDDIQTLRDAFSAAVHFSEEPHGWLVFLGQSFCGKTHLAAAIGNYRIALGGQAILVEVSALFDYLRQSFHPNSDVSFDRRFQEIRSSPLLLLDDLKESNAGSAWTEDRLHGLLNYRYNMHQPTVLTSALDADSFALNYPSLWNKLLDSSRCQVISINMPPYRHSIKPYSQGKKRKVIMPITYATSHIDGGLDCSSLSIGILKSVPDSPIVKAMVIAGKQAHPIWALDRLALVIYSYVEAAKYHYPRGPLPIQVNVRSSLISNASTSCIVADSIIWHTSETIRSDAERLIAKLTSDARLTAHWPAKTEMNLPVNGETLRMARKV